MTDAILRRFAEARKEIDIAQSSGAFDATVVRVEEMLPELKEYQGRLGESPEVLADALDLYNEIQKAAEDAIVWANQRQHTDTRDQTANSTQAKSRALGGKLGDPLLRLADVQPGNLVVRALFELGQHKYGSLLEAQALKRAVEARANAARAGH